MARSSLLGWVEDGGVATVAAARRGGFAAATGDGFGGGHIGGFGGLVAALSGELAAAMSDAWQWRPCRRPLAVAPISQVMQSSRCRGFGSLLW